MELVGDDHRHLVVDAQAALRRACIPRRRKLGHLQVAEIGLRIGRRRWRDVERRLARQQHQADAGLRLQRVGQRFQRGGVIPPRHGDGERGHTGTHRDDAAADALDSRVDLADRRTGGDGHVEPSQDQPTHDIGCCGGLGPQAHQRGRSR